MIIPESGDEVCFLNSTLKGKVKHELDNGRLLVVLEDGFEIPAYPKELVVSKKGVSNINTVQTIQKETHTDKRFEAGLYLAFCLSKDKPGKDSVNVYLVNNSKVNTLYTIFVNDSALYKGISKGEIAADSALEITSFSLEQSEKWRQWNLHFLPFSKSESELPKPMSCSCKFKEANLVKAEQAIPFLTQKGFLVSMNNHIKKEETKTLSKEFQAINHQSKEIHHIEKVSEIIDLHIESIVLDSKGLLGGQALRIQFDHFRNALEKGHALNLQKIIFIHGIGNGILKDRIRDYLKPLEFVEKFQDADHAKFGAGATEVIYLNNPN